MSVEVSFVVHNREISHRFIIAINVAKLAALTCAAVLFCAPSAAPAQAMSRMQPDAPQPVEAVAPAPQGTSPVSAPVAAPATASARPASTSVRTTTPAAGTATMPRRGATQVANISLPGLDISPTLPEGAATRRAPARTASSPARTQISPAKKTATPRKDVVPETAYQDIEIWLGERVGRFGDYEFAVSGGGPGTPTPKGAFLVQWKNINHWSKQYDAPMPFAQFFSGGAAIHKGDVGGQSHGCVRVPESAARYLFPRTREKITRVFVYP